MNLCTRPDTAAPTTHSLAGLWWRQRVWNTPRLFGHL